MVTQRADLSNRAAIIPGADAPAKEKGSLTESFQSFFASGSQESKIGNHAADATANLKSGYSQKGEYDKINSTYSKQADRMNKSQVDRNSSTDHATSTSKEYSKDELDTMKEEIYSVVKESTGMTDEEIDAVLESMDISVFQLLQPEILQEFLMNQSGTEPVDLLTNQDLIQAFQDMNQGMQNILEEQDMDLSEYDLNSFVQMLEDSDQGLQIAMDDPSMTGVQASEFDPMEMANGLPSSQQQFDSAAETVIEGETEERIPMQEEVQGTDDAAVTITDTRRPDDHSVKALADGKEDIKTDSSAEERTEVDEESGIQVSVRNADNKKEQNSSEMMNQNPNFAGDIVNQLSQAVQETESVTASYTSVLEQQDIVRQVVEQIRVWNAGENSRMQVQLYPEHLGRIEIQVMLRNGTMTAQITAETEMAKAAIESQLQALKESFEQKNMQVNAIEVNVGTPDFHSEEDRQDSMNQDSRAGSRRRRGGIQGGFGAGADDDALIADEEDRLEAQGASVEYKA